MQKVAYRWKANYLFLGRGETLIKATLSNLPTNYLSLLKSLKVWPPKLSGFKVIFMRGQDAFKPHYIKWKNFEVKESCVWLCVEF